MRNRSCDCIVWRRCRVSVFVIVVVLESKLARRPRTVNLSKTPVLLQLSGFSFPQHCYLFDSANMTSQPPSGANGLVERAVSDLQDRMEAIPGGSIAGEEEFADWGKTFVKAMVRP